MEDAELELKDINALLIGNEVATYIFGANSNDRCKAVSYEGVRWFLTEASRPRKAISSVKKVNCLTNAYIWSLD